MFGSLAFARTQSAMPRIRTMSFSMSDRAPSLGAIFAGRGQNQNPMTEA
jgi:hypothetical protein